MINMNSGSSFEDGNTLRNETFGGEKPKLHELFTETRDYIKIQEQQSNHWSYVQTDQEDNR